MEESTSKIFVQDDETADEELVGDAPELDALEIPDDLPILPLRGVVVYPHTAMPLTIGQPRSIRLVDDVATTGSTLNECARVLKWAGAEKVECLVLAKTITT